MLHTCPFKVILKNSSIEILVKRYSEFTLLASIKASRKNISYPWSIRYYELGTAKYIKYKNWDEVKQDLVNRYFIYLDDNMKEKVESKIVINKLTN
jgi:hypothetical protein